MNILAIETSCDETAAAIISGDLSSKRSRLLSNVVISQINIFKAYGGVIPEVAARSHLEAILPVIHQAFIDAGFTKTTKIKTTESKTANTKTTESKTANTKTTESKTAQVETTKPDNFQPTDDWSKIDAIAVTHTPGLLGSLLIGTLTARMLAILHNKPLYAVHHLKSHIYANWLNSSTEPSFPLLALVISGGHTQIIRMENHNQFKIIGTTLDDAVGECFDKVAKILGLPYPGGPAISSTAKSGNPKKYLLPHPNINGLDFSFSGLKTAVLRSVQKELDLPISHPSHDLANHLTSGQVADFAASFEDTACDILLEKLNLALSLFPDTKSVVIAGGVSANQLLRKKAKTTLNSTSIFFPKPSFSGDNAAMVGVATFYEIAKKVPPTDPYSLNIFPRSEIS